MTEEAPQEDKPIAGRFRLAHLFYATAAIAVFVQLSLWATPIIPLLVPIAVFFIALRPMMGRYEIPISSACVKPSLWAIGVNGVAFPLAIAISSFAPPLPSDEHSPYHDRPLELEPVIIVFAYLFSAVLGMFIGCICSLLMTAIAFMIRRAATHSRPPKWRA